MGTSKGVFEQPWLAQVVNDPLHRAESAFPRSLYQGIGRLVGHLNRGNRYALTFWKSNGVVIPLGEALLDLGLGRRDHCMAKAPSQVHGYQGNNLYGLARTRGLLDQDVFGRPADIGH